MTDATCEFNMTAHSSKSEESGFPAAGPLVAIVILASVLILTACALGWSPPVWIQPTVVGLLWANLFLLGLAAGNVFRGSALFACFTFGLLWLSKIALSKVTDLSSSECLLVAAVILGIGWCIALIDNIKRRQHASHCVAIQFRQWTIWDLATLTTLVAVVCFSVQKIDSPTLLLANVAFVLVGGVLCSWTAYRWVFDDHWNLAKLLALFVVGSLSLWIIGRQSPTDFSLFQMLVWMLTGPLAVIASQAMAVLIHLSAIRIDVSMRKSSDVPSLVSPVSPLRIYSA